MREPAPWGVEAEHSEIADADRRALRPPGDWPAIRGCPNRLGDVVPPPAGVLVTAGFRLGGAHAGDLTNAGPAPDVLPHAR
jgi:hypothetical protein